MNEKEKQNYVEGFTTIFRVAHIALFSTRSVLFNSPLVIPHDNPG